MNYFSNVEDLSLLVMLVERVFHGLIEFERNVISTIWNTYI